MWGWEQVLPEAPTSFAIVNTQKPPSLRVVLRKLVYVLPQLFHQHEEHLTGFWLCSRPSSFTQAPGQPSNRPQPRPRGRGQQQQHRPMAPSSVGPGTHRTEYTCNRKYFPHLQNRSINCCWEEDKDSRLIKKKPEAKNKPETKQNTEQGNRNPFWTSRTACGIARLWAEFHNVLTYLSKQHASELFKNWWQFNPALLYRRLKTPSTCSSTKSVTFYCTSMACFSERQGRSLGQPQSRAPHALTLIEVVVYFLEPHTSLGWFLLHRGRVVSHSTAPLL